MDVTHDSSSAGEGIMNEVKQFQVRKHLVYSVYIFDVQCMYNANDHRIRQCSRVKKA